MANSLTSSGLSITHTYDIKSSGTAQPSTPSIGGLTVSAASATTATFKLPSSGTYLIISVARSTANVVYSLGSLTLSGGTAPTSGAAQGNVSSIRIS